MKKFGCQKFIHNHRPSFFSTPLHTKSPPIKICNTPRHVTERIPILSTTHKPQPFFVSLLNAIGSESEIEIYKFNGPLREKKISHSRVDTRVIVSRRKDMVHCVIPVCYHEDLLLGNTWVPTLNLHAMLLAMLQTSDHSKFKVCWRSQLFSLN